MIANRRRRRRFFCCNQFNVLTCLEAIVSGQCIHRNSHSLGIFYTVRILVFLLQLSLALARCSHPERKNPQEGDFASGRLLTLGWNQLEELCLDWLSDARVCFR